MKKIIVLILILALTYTLFFYGEQFNYKAKLVLFNISSSIKPVSYFLEYIKFKRDLVEENTVLKQQIMSLNHLRYENLSLRADLKELLKQDKFSDEDNVLQIKELIPSFAPRVNNLYVVDTADLSLGNHLVFSMDGWLLASVFVHDESYIQDALLFSAQKRQVPAYLIISDEQKQKITLRGIGYGSFIAHLNKEFKVKIKDAVYYRGHALGVIQKIESKEQDPYLTLYISLPVNLDNLTYVKIK